MNSVSEIAVVHEPHAGGGALVVIPLVLIGIPLIAYVSTVVASRARGRPWPPHRLVLWLAGLALATVSATGPLAEAAHVSFLAHVWAHVLGGMLAPVCLVLAAPFTLALRTMHVTPARRLSRLLRCRPAAVLAHPVTAAVLSAGGLWAIYLSPVFNAMRTDALVHALVQVHLVGAGYLFAASVIGLDPAPHRPRRLVGAVVLAMTAASHAILAKHLYAHPPGSLSLAEAQAGAQLMYYVGGWVEASVVVIFCAQWYAEAGRRLARTGRPTPVP
ncbi:cytochrome c oxidase assembly protein [Microbacterium ureisolvens]|uniref:cytochrome c oxidase assembly protein n=1 Tax=Microbacterium ureisolvens TaxID=2781186 RepID=UPI00364456B5